MARVCTTPKILPKILFFSFLLSSFPCLISANRELDEENWKEILKGEWMVEFYAPWCPACNALAPAWKELSTRANQKTLTVRTAAVDVTKSPGLSGRFVVTALPTIYHVKEGEFRQYKGPRDAEAMLSYVEQQRWKQSDPIPGWKAPDSFQMTVVAEFFKLSQALRSVHTMLMETYGLPTWGSYLIFAVATIFVGAILGLILVCVIDLLYPPRRSDKVTITRSELEELAKGDQRRPDDEQALLNEDIVDDAETANSDAEKNSGSDSSDEEKEKPEEGADAKTEGKDEKTNEVRKRRPRKAD